MFSGDWTPPCGSCCTKKYASLVHIPWRVFCKKGCNADGDTWEECRYLTPDYAHVTLTMECFNACVSGCGYRFEIPTEKVEEIKPNRPSKPPPPEVKPTTGPDSAPGSREDVPCTSA
ncbi:uncharacterized protein C2845_PM15G26250 [Panicum miliaceum]|uniref:Uncharacterized protein n=1 Tax=Panicum miliaceum TaxID=4540 RepID=A0A3L6QCF4_PANMI|nr:uncharacterized protein C2845_PM15G26250 [Panicum miliaceum]